MKPYFRIIKKNPPTVGGLNSSETCPYCHTAFVDFADIKDGLIYGCYACGGIFMSRACIEHEKEAKKVSYVCVCGFIAKSNAGLKVHQRKCEKWISHNH